ncbi:MAG: hypothetical protein P8179_06050 [Candidatus Thiodiazotropha sp.]|jgi:hypothetical protein
MKKNIWQGTLLLLALCSQSVLANAPLWLSDTAPNDESAGHQHMSHGGPVERGKRGVFQKRLWVRSGKAPAEAAYVIPEGELSAQLIIPDKSQAKLKQSVKDQQAQLVFSMPDEGFYNAYLTQRIVDNNQLEITTAKAEVLKHSCREGHDHVKDLMPPNHLSDIPLEIVRERLPNENFHSRVAYGDVISFLVLAKGEPVSGAEVTLYTRSGWQNSSISDEQGHATFTIIRDYFPSWEFFESRHRQEFLAVAKLQRDETGSYQGESYSGVSYVATLPGAYFPSSRDYQSYGYGLSFGLFGLTFSGLSVYLYRRRRIRPYKEVRFDD